MTEFLPVLEVGGTWNAGTEWPRSSEKPNEHRSVAAVVVPDMRAESLARAALAKELGSGVRAGNIDLEVGRALQDAVVHAEPAGRIARE
jgi:hypothetical protein